MHMASAEVEAYRKRMRKLVWGLGTKVDRKQVIVGGALMCISLSAITMLLARGAVTDTPLFGARVLAAFVLFVGVLAGYMIMHRGTERSWL